MRLVEISYEEYCALFDAGAWVQSDSKSTIFWDKYRNPLNRRADPKKYDFNEEWRYYTRVEEEDHNSMPKLVEISYEEYCTLGEAGAWVNWDVEPYDDACTLLRQASMAHYVKRRSDLLTNCHYKFFTRTNDDE